MKKNLKQNIFATQTEGQFVRGGRWSPVARQHFPIISVRSYYLDLLFKASSHHKYN